MKTKVQQPEKVLKQQYVPTSEFYSQIIDSLQDYAIFTMDAKLKINSWNSGAAKIFQYETEEIIGEHFSIIFTKEDQKKEIPKLEIKTALKEGRATDNRWHIRKDGSKFFAYGLVFPLTGIDDEMLGYVKILRNLTEIKKSEDAIKKQLKEQEELITHKESILAILSHDLRSPLAGIIGTTEYLEKNFAKMEPRALKQMLELLNKSAKDELSMLDYLVEWARIKYASEIFCPAQIELSEYVKKVFEILNETAAVNTINLHHEIKEKTKVFADGKMLLSVLQNIVSNAIKHSKKGGKITVTAKIKKDKIIVQIKDTGIGMSKEIQERLFTPQIGSLAQVRKEGKGAGIGLLLVKGFLEKNSGEIWVESIEGVGSSFYFTLPLKKPLKKIEKNAEDEMEALS